MRGGKYLSFDMFWPTKSTNIRLSPTQLLCQLCRLCLKWCNPEFFTHPHFPANLLMALASMILCSGLVMPQLAQRLGSMVSTTLPSFSNLSMMTVLFSCSRSQSNWSFNLRLMKDAKKSTRKTGFQLQRSGENIGKYESQKSLEVYIPSGRPAHQST